MSSDAASFAARMVDHLMVTDPELDTSVGTEPRKIIDMLAEQLAEISMDKDMLSYRFDIDSKVGADLDEFAGMFGFTRFAARRAQGVVTLYRPSAAPQAIFIPAGTQVSTASVENPQVFATVGPAWMARGTSNVEIPVRAVIGGSAGNLPANSLTILVNGVEDLSNSCINYAATTGGADEETDEALIARFKRTVFRSLAGTEDMYLGVALENDPVAVSSGTAPTQAAVVGVASKWREQVQIESDGTGSATIPADNVKYVFEDSFVLGTDIESGQIFSQGVHYTVDTSSMPPTIQSISLEPGEIYDLEFEYTSSASRNDPGAGISNRIDVWVNGENLVEAGETFTFNPSRTFSSDSDADLYNGKFVRLNTPGQSPAAGNPFTQLSYGPIHSFPDLLTIAGTEFREREDYFIVHDDSAFGYGPTSRHGIEWVGTPPMQDAQVGVTYYYNHIPSAVEARIRRWRLVGTDARAHAGKAARLLPHFAIMYDRGSSLSRVNTAIFQALSRFMNSRGFGAQIQISDMLHVVSGVTGVDNVRLARSTDDPAQYGIEEVTATGIRIRTWTTDVLLRDDQMPVLHDVRLLPRAQNTIY